MSRLPFVIQPKFTPKPERIGSEEAGYIEIERKGYLTAGEMAFAQANGTAEAGVGEILALARKVATKYSVDLKKAYTLVVENLGDSGQPVKKYPVLEDFGTELGELMEFLMRQEAVKKHIKALCLLVYRVDSEIETAEVSELHPDIVEGLAELFDEEEARSVVKLNAAIGDGNEEAAEETASDAEDLEKK